MGTFQDHRLAVSALGPPQDQKLRIGGVDPGEILGSLGCVENLWKKKREKYHPYGSKHCLRRYLSLQIIVNYTTNTS